MELMEKIRITREFAKDCMLLGKPITIEYDKKYVTDETQKYIQSIEDFFNDNFEKMYDQMILYGTWIIVRLKDGSLELV